MLVSTIALFCFLKLTTAAFYHPAAYQPDPPRQPMRRGDHVQDVLAKRAVTPKHVYTEVTPSSGAKPVPITSQFQVVTSYIPLYTLCGLPNATASSALPTFVPPNMPVFNNSMRATMSPSMGVRRRADSLTNSTAVPAFPGAQSASKAPRLGQPVPLASSPTSATPATQSQAMASPLSLQTPHTPLAPLSSAEKPPFPMPNGTQPYPVATWRNATNLNVTSTPTCTTHYSTTRTAVCHTVLKGLAAHHTVTNCDQLITYSTQYGYTLQVPPGVTNPATLPSESQPYVVTLTTYSEAPWTDFTAATGVPSSVTEKICSSPIPQGEQTCVDIRKGLQTRIDTSVTRTTSHVDLTTTLPGPSKIIVETFQADITEIQTVLVLKTRFVSEISTEGVATVTTDVQTLGSSTVAAPPAETTQMPSEAQSPLTLTSTVGRTSTSTV